MNTPVFSFAHLANLQAIEKLYEQYKQNPEEIDPSWRSFFEGWQLASAVGAERAPVVEGGDELRVFHLIEAYRRFGHLKAMFNPLESGPSPRVEELELSRYGFTEEDLERNIPTCGFLPENEVPLKVLIEALLKTYCRSVGVECFGLDAPDQEEWLQQKIEPFFPLNLEEKHKRRIYDLLAKADLFETFLHTKYVGQKRFSLEGGETLIPMLALLLDRGAEMGVTEIVLGMAHRGRLNVLANILGKSYLHIFREFEDQYLPELIYGSGDVKYHKGFSGTYHAADGHDIQVTLSANPSHLESVDPVVQGIVRAKQERMSEEQREKDVIPVLIHGDAAVAGQGVVYETLQMSRLKGYGVGGTIHIVVNNQIGFTTLPKDSRSTRYCTDIAKAFGAPVFHVNVEDPEGAVAATLLALEMRQKFHCDVFLDLCCYRKYGHNEGDEPRFTQPLQYELIGKKKAIRHLYLEKMITEGIIKEEEAKQLEGDFRKTLEDTLEKVKSSPPQPEERQETPLQHDKPNPVSVASLQELGKKLSTVPEDLKVHRKIERFLQERSKSLASPEDKTIDWATGELLAYATLLKAGIGVRIAGQDCQRGTFSHRQAVWVDQENNRNYFPLSHISDDQAPCALYNSHLSEFAALGFEFGYSLPFYNHLVIWEAQFGDFVNGGQIVIDQYIAPSLQKWGLRSKLVLYLPHGYEGQGPEHSSGRIERFLQLCGNENMRVCNCSTPAQLYHLLRDQGHCQEGEPLVLFTPKVLLRHPACVSSLEELANGEFNKVLVTKAQDEKTLFFCSGKIFYELEKAMQERQITDTTLVRIEQLYPFPEKEVVEILFGCKELQRIAWVQEEHANMGPWQEVEKQLEKIAERKIEYIGRKRSASPAAGSFALHTKELNELLETAFGKR